MAEPVILVVSKDKDFAATLAEHAKGELKLSCIAVESKEAAKAHLDSAVMVVTSEADGDYPCPALKVGRPPIRLQDVLEDMEGLRRRQSADDISLGKAYLLQVRAKQLTHVPSGKSVVLTDKEMKILQHVAYSKGKVVPKDSLLKNVWGIDSGLDTHTLETHIYRLRGKVRELADEDAIIAEDGGYVLVI